MSALRLIFRSLLFYWRTHAAVLLGAAAATAVVGGAFVVGDSVRGSLRQMTLVRLGRIDHAISSQRFFREALADELAKDPDFASRFTNAAPAISLMGSLEHADGTILHRVGRVQVYGVDERLWSLLERGAVAVPAGRDILVNRRVAEQLAIASTSGGDSVTLTIELPADIPRDALLGERDAATREIGFTIREVLDDALGAARFDLNPSQQLPLVAFVPLDTLQDSLDLAESAPSRRNPTGMPARVNSLFVEQKPSDTASSTAPADSAAQLTATLAKSITLADIDLRIRQLPERGYFALESDRQILEDSLARTAEQIAEGLRLRTSPVLVYLANELSGARSPDRFSMYSVIAGVDFADMSEPPFGPFGGTANLDLKSLGPNDILVNDWLANDLNVKVGDDIAVAYHVVGSHGELPEKTHQFRTAGIVSLEESSVADTGFTPEVKGITDAKTFRDWDQPFPMKLERITKRDEEYWDEFKTTPKGFVPLRTAQELWGSRYGRLTSVRIAKSADQPVAETSAEFTRQFLHALKPEQTGLAFRPVKSEGLQAATGSNDFSQLFIGFSFFLILSAAILVALLFRLGIERRASSIGVMSAVGMEPRSIGRIVLGEGLIVVLAGAILGTMAAVYYARVMVYGLKTWWNRAIGTQFLDVYANPASLAAGFLIALFVAVLAVRWGMRQLRAIRTRDLLAGTTEIEQSEVARAKISLFTARLARSSLVLALLLLGATVAGFVPSSDAFGGLTWQVVCFFIVGIMLLATSWLYLSAWLAADKRTAVHGRGVAAFARLGIRNAARQRSRSVLTAGLISSATFVIVAVSAGHRNPAAEKPDRNSGNGGFSLVAESSRPILQDLNSVEIRTQMNFQPDAEGDAALFASMRAIAFRVQPGEDASCLNAYQTRTPTILGVPQEMIDRGGFKFVDAKGDRAWRVLLEPTSDGSIPVIGDMNTLQYSLHKGLGNDIVIPDSAQRPQRLKIAGMLDGSIFQGVLLVSEEAFLKLYPDRAGYEYFLIDSGGHDANDLAQKLETGLRDYGFDAEPVSERLADFLAVQNTYLSTFQTLGGLGLLLGTFGLATVMLRNVLERRAELALLRAVGFENRSIAALVLWENVFLLAWGLLTGTGAALLAMTPHLLSIGADVPWISVLIILAAVFAAGMLAALLAVAEAVRTPIVATLRSE